MKSSSLSPALKKTFRNISMLVMDFDGVLTDNGVYLDRFGREMVRCDRSDGLGLGLVKARGDVHMLILSKEKNPVVSARAKKLGIRCMQGIDDKWQKLKSELRRLGVTPQDTCYVGNDVNDVACMEQVGLAIAVADAYPPARAVARYVTLASGGRGAIREVCDLLIASKTD